MAEENELKFKFLSCSCGACGLGVTQDLEYKCLYISIWHSGSYKMSLLQKLRWCWHIMNGTPFNDNVILDPPQVADLIELGLPIIGLDPNEEELVIRSPTDSPIERSYT